MAARALTVAIVASVLFVVVISVDAAMNRTSVLEMNQDGRWVAVAQHPTLYDEYRRELPFSHAINASDTVEFRLRVDNGYPWAMAESWSASTGGVLVGEGRVEAPAFGEATATFSVNGTRLLTGGYGGFYEGPRGEVVYAHIEMRVGSEFFSASPAFREVPR